MEKNFKLKLVIQIILALALSAITMVDVCKTSPNVTTEGIVCLSVILFAMYLIIIYIITTVFHREKNKKAAK